MSSTKKKTLNYLGMSHATAGACRAPTTSEATRTSSQSREELSGTSRESWYNRGRVFWLIFLRIIGFVNPKSSEFDHFFGSFFFCAVYVGHRVVHRVALLFVSEIFGGVPLRARQVRNLRKSIQYK